jgi:hypothetical protein
MLIYVSKTYLGGREGRRERERKKERETDLMIL